MEDGFRMEKRSGIEGGSGGSRGSGVGNWPESMAVEENGGRLSLSRRL